MELYKIILNIVFLENVYSLIIKKSEDVNNTVNKIDAASPDNVFNGVYTECFLHLSYSCLQKKTLLYLKELNNLSEVSVIGDYVKFVKVNSTTLSGEDDSATGNTDELAFLIDKAVDDFFDNHVLKFNALGRDISIPRNLDVFVGRKKRKGGGGGDMMMGGHGHDDKKKMMMMAMMCMKMKLMMMVPAMMGMMGMMSFKGMMFSMMSFMISKMMLLMKILEKKGGAGGLGGSGGGGDGGWAAAGGGGGAWMPAGGQDIGGGGYDANGQWQSRSIAEALDILNKPTEFYNGDRSINDPEKYVRPSYRSSMDDIKRNDNIFAYKTLYESPNFEAIPEISYVKPVVRFNNKIEEEVFKKPVLAYKKSNVDFSNYGGVRDDDIQNDVKSTDVYIRSKRSLSQVENKIYSQDYKKYKDKELEENADENTKIKKVSNRENRKTKYIERIENSDQKSNLYNISRKKRSLLDILQNSYAYWMTTLLGLNNNRRTNFQKYKIINGIRYVYYPFKALKTKTPKEIQLNSVKLTEFKPIITAEDFNKGEIMEGGVEARMHRKKFTKVKDTVNDTMEDNPWQ